MLPSIDKVVLNNIIYIYIYVINNVGIYIYVYFVIYNCVNR